MTDGARPVRASWWLDRGDTVCVSCADAFPQECTIRCPDCDGCVCATCVIDVRDAEGAVVALCHACAEARG